MGVVFRQSIKSTIVIFTGAVLGALSTFLCTFALTKAELGFFTNIIYLGATIHMFVMLGMGSVLAVFIQKYDAQSEKRRVLITLSAVTTFIATLLFSAIFILFKQPIVDLYKPQDRPLVERFFYWIPVLTLLWGFMSLYEHYLVSQIKIAVSAFTKEVLLRVFNLALLALYMFKVIDFDLFIIGNILVYAVAAAILFFISSRTEGFGFSGNWAAFNTAEYKEILHFAWYHLLLMVSINLMNYIDTLMLAPLDNSGMESAAAYRVALFIATVMVMPFRAMTGSSYATLNQAYIDNDMPKLRDLFSRAGVNILIASVGMLIIIGNNLDNAVAILPEGYEIVKPIVLILMLGRLIDMATGLNNEMISISKYYKFNFRLSALLIIMVIVLDRALIPKYGVYGAAWGATISLGIFNIFKLIFLWKKMDLHPFTRGTLYVFVAGLLAGAAGYFFPYLFHSVDNVFIRTALDVVVRTTVTGLAYAGLLLWLKPSPDIKTYLDTVKENKRLF